MLKGVLLAFQFCTIVPVRVPGDVTEKDVADSAAFFPLVGAFQGLACALAAFVLIRVFPPEVSAALAVLCLILTDGGFDLDGLADTFDALSVKSSGDPDKDRARRLSVMKDSATGAIGVIALIMLILLKFTVMAGLLSGFPVITACAVFFLAALFSKWIVVPVIYHGSPARKDGLGKIFLDGVRPAHLAASTGIVLLLLLPVAWLGFTTVPPANAVALCACFCAGAYLSTLFVVRFLTRRFGGLTGDHFGALTECCQAAFLLAAYLWLRHSAS